MSNSKNLKHIFHASQPKYVGATGLAAMVSFSMAIALLLVGPSVFIALPEGAVVAILLLTVGALLYMAVRNSFATDRPYVGVQCLLIVAFFVHYAVGGALLCYWDSLPWRSAVNYNLFQLNGAKENMPMAAYVALLAGLGLYCGSCLRFNAKYPPPRDAMRDLGSIQRSVVPLAAIFFFLSVVIVPAAPKNVQQMAQVFGSFAQILVVIIAFMAASSQDVAARWRWWIICVICYILLAAPSLRSGMREDFIKPLALIAIGWIAGRRRVPWKTGLVMLAAFIFLALPVLNLAKQYALDGNREGIARLNSARLDVADRDYTTVMEDVFANALARVNLLSFVAVYSRFYPLDLPFLYGETFLLETIEFVPRLFWPEKPEVGPMLDGYARQVGVINAGDSQTSAKFDAVTEYFINFGAVGVFVLSLLHGAFYRLTEAVLRRFVSPMLVTFMIGVMMVQNNDFFSFVMLLPSHLKQVIVWVGIVALVRSFEPRVAQRRIPALVQSPVVQRR